MTSPRPMQHFVILGGGTAGWITAAGLARLLLRNNVGKRAVTLVSSEEIGVVGVGEATVPSILDMVRFLNIDEKDFLRETDATYKLGIRFKDWSGPGSDFWHAFGDLGPTVETLPLFQLWLREKTAGRAVGSLSDLSISAQMAAGNRFAKPTADRKSPLSMAGYAYHFDAVKVADYLRGYAEHGGVKHVEGRVRNVEIGTDGQVAGLLLDDGRRVDGDFFIDCSGFAGVIIDKALGSPYEDWSHWLPCDRAVAMGSGPADGLAAIAPYTVVTARDAGWTWRIPLQSRNGNGYVWSSRFTDQDTATRTLEAAIDGTALSPPRHLRFTPGRRKQSWVKNCLSLGLASGFLEPLESTSIHLIFANLFRFFDHFPHNTDAGALRDAYNARCTREIEEIRDFLILHYCRSTRRDTPFWQHVTSMALPDSLDARIEAFCQHGKILADYYDLFRPVSWIAIYDGLGVRPRTADPLAEMVPVDFARKVLQDVAGAIRQTAAAQPVHDTVLPRIPSVAALGP